MFRRLASTTSGFVGPTADETTTTSVVADVPRVVSFLDAYAEPLEPLRHLRSLQIRAADDVAEVRQQLRDPAHADPADADEVNPPRASEHRV